MFLKFFTSFRVFHSGTAVLSSSVCAVLRICSSQQHWRGCCISQPSTTFLECLLSVRAFHISVADEIIHTDCWQPNCSLKYCAMLYICVRFYCRWHVRSIQLRVWTDQIVLEISGVQTRTEDGNILYINTKMWKLIGTIHPKPRESIGFSGGLRDRPISRGMQLSGVGGTWHMSKFGVKYRNPSTCCKS
jgi:hypothetical protein